MSRKAGGDEGDNNGHNRYHAGCQYRTPDQRQVVGGGRQLVWIARQEFSPFPCQEGNRGFAFGDRGLAD